MKKTAIQLAVARSDTRRAETADDVENVWTYNNTKAGTKFAMNIFM
jgi:hypothetical protein